MLNRCEFIGNLGADPEIRTTQAGKKIANLRIAVSEKWKTREGERREKTTWVPVVIFSEGLVRVAEQYLRKGSKVYVAGKFEVRKWQDQSGNDRYSTEVTLQGYDATLVMLDGKPDARPQGGAGGPAQGSPADPAMQAPGGFDDEIPF